MAILPLAFTWPEFFQQVVTGLAIGGVYASLALALVLIYRATHVVNFAQGEMAMFSTYIAWALIENHGWSYWPAFFATLVIAFVLRRRDRAGDHPAVREQSPLTVIIATIALFVILNGLAQWIWAPEVKAFLSPFPEAVHDRRRRSSPQDVGVVVVTLVTVARPVGCSSASRSSGLAMRAAAIEPVASRLLGVRVGWMFAIGWGFAAILGAVVRDDGRADRLPRPDDDADGAHLRLRGGGARRHREPGRRGRRRLPARRRTTLLGAYVDSIPSSAARPTSCCRSRSRPDPRPALPAGRPVRQGSW